MAIGNGQAIKAIVGGSTSSGRKGVFRAVVVDASLGVAKRSGRPYIALEFHGKGDTENPSVNGKKLIVGKFYTAMEGDDEEKVKTMNGMLKSRLYRGFGLPWPKDGKQVDPRIFLKKEVYIAIGPGNPNEQGDSFPEVKAIAQKKEQLPESVLRELTKKDSKSESAAED
jgi:hypothetical protein